MTFPIVQNSPLPPNTIVPEDKDLFTPYFNSVYEDIAFAVNNKDDIYFPFAITNTAANIPNLPNFGSYIICVSAAAQASDGSWPPTITASLCKSSSSAAGSVAVLGSQTGQGGGTWGGATLTISSTATNFQIKHSVASTTGNFNIKFIGTQ